VFEHHEVVDEEDALALEQLPDRLASLALGLCERLDVVLLRHRQQVRPVRVLKHPRISTPLLRGGGGRNEGRHACTQCTRPGMYVHCIVAKFEEINLKVRKVRKSSRSTFTAASRSHSLL